MGQHSRKPRATSLSDRRVVAGTAFGGLAAWIGMAIAWFGLSLKLTAESLLRACLRPSTTTILDIPAAVPSQFPPLNSIRKDLLALGEPANDSSVPPARHPQPAGEPLRVPSSDPHPAPRA